MIRWIFRILIGLGGLGCLVLAVLGYYFRDDFMLGRNLTPESLSYPIIITDRHGEELHRIFGNENREWISLEDISPNLKMATILAEDHRFYQHKGVDFLGILRAVWRNIEAGYFKEGASTLTQQIARKVHLTDQKTIERKLREMAIAAGMETKFSKNEILEMYLNTVPYGPRINGVKLASQTYFSKSPDELDMAEALILAALPKDPVRLSKKREVWKWLGDCDQAWVCSPFEAIDYKSERIEKLLFKVAEYESWEQQTTKDVWEQLAQIKLGSFRRKWTNDDFQHWRFFVLDFLTDKGFDFSKRNNGLIIRTSLDSRFQEELYKFLREKASTSLYQDFGIENFALMILDHETRGPIVWMGSKSFWNTDIHGQVDVLRSRRQVGSTIKPFIYGLAIDRGYQPPTLLSDTPIAFHNSNHRVSNADGRFYGRMTMGDALVWSRNIPAVKAFYLAGGEWAVRHKLDKLFNFGINDAYKTHKFYWTLALGGVPLRIMDLGNAYASLGTNQYQEVCPILEITDSLGNPVSSPCIAENTKTLDSSMSFFISDMLSDVKKRPWRWGWNITPTDHPGIAVKTGTASKRVNGEIFPTDNVIAGYTPESTIVMWAGNTNGRALKQGSLSVVSIGVVWRQIAEKFFTAYPHKYTAFEMPESLKDQVVKYRNEWTFKDYQDRPYNELYAQSIHDYGAWMNHPDYVPPAKVVEEAVAPQRETIAQTLNRYRPTVKKKVSKINKEKVRERIRLRRQKRAGY